MRLRAAAGALFPLAGEEKKSKSEAERHRLTAYLSRLAHVKGRDERPTATVGSSLISRPTATRGSKPLEHRSDKSSVRGSVSI
jgi:hypothetical protein